MALRINSDTFFHKGFLLTSLNGETITRLSNVLVIVNANMIGQKAVKVPTGTQDKLDSEGNPILDEGGNVKQEFVFKDMVEVQCQILAFSPDETTQIVSNSMDIQGIPFGYALQFDPTDERFGGPDDVDQKLIALQENLIEIITSPERNPQWKDKIEIIPNPNPIK